MVRDFILCDPPVATGRPGPAEFDAIQPVDSRQSVFLHGAFQCGLRACARSQLGFPPWKEDWRSVVCSEQGQLYQHIPRAGDVPGGTDVGRLGHCVWIFPFQIRCLLRTRCGYLDFRLPLRYHSHGSVESRDQKTDGQCVASRRCREVRVLKKFTVG